MLPRVEHDRTFDGSSVNNRLRERRIEGRVDIKNCKKISGVLLNLLLLRIPQSISQYKQTERGEVERLVRCWTELSIDQMVTILCEEVCHRHLHPIRAIRHRRAVQT